MGCQLSFSLYVYSGSLGTGSFLGNREKNKVGERSEPTTARKEPVRIRAMQTKDAQFVNSKTAHTTS